MSNTNEQAQEQTRLLQCILDSMGDGVVVADQSGKFVLFNPAAQRILGNGAMETSPDRWSDDYGCFLPDGITPFPSADLPLARAIRGETVESARMLIRHAGRPDGVWLNVTARPLREEFGVVRGGVAVLRDITDFKRAEEALHIARKDAEDANHAKSEFLSRMSHELRTPLNAILGFAQLLEIDDLRTDQLESVGQILKGGRHLLTLINEILDIARIEAGRLALSTEPIQIEEALRSSIALVEPLATQRGILISLAPSRHLAGHVLADQQRLQQVLLNLLSNAIKYNREAGRVNVNCSAIQPGKIRLEVTDTGLGIPPEKISLLFVPFERIGADASGIEGSGIGLALSKRLTEAMGGVLGVDSTVGQGSTFWVDLQLTEGPVETYTKLHASEVAEPADDVSVPPKSMVLYIEDNPSNSLLMERILKNRPGIELISAIQGSLGIELAKQHRPVLILLDLHLPDMHGSQVLEELRAHPQTSHIPLAIISADATAGQIERLIAAGAKTYFTKPLDVKGLLQFIDETITAGAMESIQLS